MCSAPSCGSKGDHKSPLCYLSPNSDRNKCHKVPLISVTKGQKAKRSLKFLKSLNLPVRFCMVSNCCSSGCFSRPPLRKQTSDTLQHDEICFKMSIYTLATLVNTSVQRPVISTNARKAVCESNSNDDCSMQRQLWLRTLLTPSMPQKQPPSLAPSFSSFYSEFLVKSSWFKPRCPYLHKCFQDPLHLSSTANFANHSFSFSLPIL